MNNLLLGVNAQPTINLTLLCIYFGLSALYYPLFFRNRSLVYQYSFIICHLIVAFVLSVITPPEQTFISLVSISLVQFAYFISEIIDFIWRKVETRRFANFILRSSRF